MEHILLGAITNQMKSHVTGKSQHGFSKGKSCLTDMITLYDKTCLVDVGWVVNTVYLDFSKDFEMAPQSPVLEKPMCQGSGQVVPVVSGELTDRLHSEGGGE